MGHPARFLLTIVVGVGTALAVASCGGSDARLLPGNTARDITANLDTVRQLADEGDCVGAESAARQVSEQVDALGGIDAKLKRALQEGAARLSEVVARCESEGEETVPTTLSPEGEATEEKPAGKKKQGAGREKQEEEGQGEEETTPTTPESTTTEPSPSPKPEGEGSENGSSPPGAEEGNEEGVSGGVGPGTPAGGGG